MDSLAPEVQASLDAQTLAFLRAVTSFPPREMTEGELVEWAADQLRASIDRVQAAVEHQQALAVGAVDEHLAPIRNCVGCGGVGLVTPVECDCAPPYAGCPHQPDPCPACGGTGKHRPLGGPR